MPEASKITLSAEELQLVTNTGWILTKRRVIEKAAELLGNHAGVTKQYLQQTKLPAALMRSAPKIARGENYLQLPWLMLDYPRVFGKEDTIAIRTMFWWGNFFSTTLHLSGRYKKQYEKQLVEKCSLLQQHGFYICINADAWQHHFEAGNYTAAASLTVKEIAGVFSGAAFIKIACKHPLQQWNQMPGLLQQSCKIILQLLED